VKERQMAQEPLPEYGAYKSVIAALAPLKPPERLTVMEWIKEAYCPDCGYPAPPSDEQCAVCLSHDLQ
jgi:hypothetical protein